VVERFSRRWLGHDAPAVRPIRADDLLVLPVRLHGIQLGRPVDLLLDRDDRRALGLDILCRDDVHRFLPLPAASIRDEELAISSPLVLLEEDQLAFYRARALALKDVVVCPGGALAELIVETEGRERRVPFDPTVRFQPKSRSAA
jgi:hypothetical protein